MRPADCMPESAEKTKVQPIDARGTEMRSAALVIALGTAAMTACAAIGFGGVRGERPEDRLARGLASLRAQDFIGARNVLDSLYIEHWAEPVGQRAALAIAAAEVDTRNADRRMWRAADVAARLLNVPKLDPWMVPLAESYYVLALELGAQEQRLAAADAAREDAERRAGARELPQSSRETVPAQINRLTAQRDEAKKQADDLLQKLAAKEKELKDTKQELERIKRTIKS
jgi:hypothetical protein